MELSQDGGKTWKQLVCVPNFTIQSRNGEFIGIKANGRIKFWVWAEIRSIDPDRGISYHMTPVKKWKQKRGHMVERLKRVYDHKLKKSYL